MTTDRAIYSRLKLRMKTSSELKKAIELLPRKDLFALGQWLREWCENEALTIPLGVKTP